MSETDMEKGKPWLDELIGALGGLKLGIVCLTRECLSEPWVLFEAGVIYKGLDRDARTWTKEALVTLLRKTNRFIGQSSSPITVREVPQRL